MLSKVKIGIGLIFVVLCIGCKESNHKKIENRINDFFKGGVLKVKVKTSVEKNNITIHLDNYGEDSLSLIGPESMDEFEKLIIARNMELFAKYESINFDYTYLDKKNNHNHLLPPIEIAPISLDYLSNPYYYDLLEYCLKNIDQVTLLYMQSIFDSGEVYEFRSCFNSTERLTNLYFILRGYSINAQNKKKTNLEANVLMAASLWCSLMGERVWIHKNVNEALLKILKFYGYEGYDSNTFEKLNNGEKVREIRLCVERGSTEFITSKQ